MLKFCKQIKEWTARKICRHGDRMAYMHCNNVVLHSVIMKHQPWSWRIHWFSIAPNKASGALEDQRIFHGQSYAMNWILHNYQERKKLRQDQPWSWRIPWFSIAPNKASGALENQCIFHGQSYAMNWILHNYQERKQLHQAAAPELQTNTFVQESQDPSQYKHTMEILTVTYSGQTLVLEDRVPLDPRKKQWNLSISKGWSEENQRSEGSAEVSFSCSLLLCFQRARKWNLRRSWRLDQKRTNQKRTKKEKKTCQEIEAQSLPKADQKRTGKEKKTWEEIEARSDRLYIAELQTSRFNKS